MVSQKRNHITTVVMKQVGDAVIRLDKLDTFLNNALTGNAEDDKIIIRLRQKLDKIIKLLDTGDFLDILKGDD